MSRWSGARPNTLFLVDAFPSLKAPVGALALLAANRLDIRNITIGWSPEDAFNSPLAAAVVVHTPNRSDIEEPTDADQETRTVIDGVQQTHHSLCLIGDDAEAGALFGNAPNERPEWRPNDFAVFVEANEQSRAQAVATLTGRLATIYQINIEGNTPPTAQT